MDTSLIGLFCIVDDFCQVFLPHWKASLLEHQDKQRNKSSRMSTRRNNDPHDLFSSIPLS
ncbi:hypothetical protein PsalN5692_01542 [Piscirickettsia salmonis]|nr:hypothetical protein PsalN5692_01542 [Piscirickettsia salmonis]